MSWISWLKKSEIFKSDLCSYATLITPCKVMSCIGKGQFLPGEGIFKRNGTRHKLLDWWIEFQRQRGPRSALFCWTFNRKEESVRLLIIRDG